MASKKNSYYRVKSSYALLYPDTVEYDYRVWAQPFTVVVVDHPVIQRWLDSQLHKVDKITAREAKKEIEAGRRHWNGEASLNGLARAEFNKQAQIEPVDLLVQIAADIDDSVPEVDDIPAPEALPDEVEDDLFEHQGRKGGDRP